MSQDNTISEVFNALSQTVFASVIDYLVANGKALNNENVVGELNRFCARAYDALVAYNVTQSN